MQLVVKMPDVGEGVAEAELVEWSVKPGDPVREDMIVASVMTDKATVEIPSPVGGTITWLGGDVGDRIAVKAPLFKIEVPGEDERPDSGPAPKAQPEETPETSASEEALEEPDSAQADVRSGKRKSLASPAVRQRAMETGIDLGEVRASGPDGRVTHGDLDRFLHAGHRPTPTARRTRVNEIRITGLRRRIAERMAISASRIPHITYVEEVDMTSLEELRAVLNGGEHPGGARLTILPFLMKAIARAVEDHPVVNAVFDDENGVLLQHEAVHVGIATQTSAGLMVPVVRHVEARTLRDCAAELSRVSQAARDNSATREELSGSTITVSSLGALGGLVSTPIINHPEVAIVGVNKLATKPHWDGARFAPRLCMNLSSSFDHRIVDGWDAARFIQRVKALMENPAMIFLDD